MTAQTPAERAAKKRQRKKDRKLKPVEIWIPIGTEYIAKALEERLQQSASTRSGKMTYEEFIALPISETSYEKVSLPDPRFPDCEGDFVQIPHLPDHWVISFEDYYEYRIDEDAWKTVNTPKGLMRARL